MSPKFLLPYLDYRPGVQRDKRSGVVGTIVLVAIIVTVFFVFVEVWTYLHASQTEDVNTGPFEEYDMTDKLNFTFNLMVGGSRVNFVVNDTWYVSRRRYLGTAVPDSYSTSAFTSPVGWNVSGSQLERILEFSFNLSDAGGFNWSLSATAGLLRSWMRAWWL